MSRLWIVVGTVVACSSPSPSPPHVSHEATLPPQAPPTSPPTVVAESCPPTAPADGDGCTTANLTCDYDSCATTGTTTATCGHDRWTLSTRPCTATTCPADSSGFPPCRPGDICVVFQSGARTAHCQKSLCAPGQLMSCACLGSGVPPCLVSHHETDFSDPSCHGCP
jgi:hypothetical protein